MGLPGLHSKPGTELNPLSGLPQAPESALSAAKAAMTSPIQAPFPLMTTPNMVGTPLEKQVLSPESLAQNTSSAALLDSSDSMSTFAALKAGEWKGLDNVMLQISGMANNPAANASQPVSTLAVLSMMDSQLSSEAIEVLAENFEQPPSSETEPNAGPTVSGVDLGRATPSGKANPATAPQALPSNMAETYEKLSAKLSTELAARMHQQINDGHWKMKFALKPASLGAVDIQLEMRDGKLAALFQADNPLTQDLLQHGSHRLKQALSEMGLTQTSVQVGQGQGQNAGQSPGQSNTQPGSSQFGDNHGQAETGPTDAVSNERPRRSSLSQFDLYA
jgi:flagellar hook-length control protein FliK